MPCRISQPDVTTCSEESGELVGLGRVLCVTRSTAAHGLDRVQPRLRWETLNVHGITPISGCLLIEQLAQQDGQGDAHKKKHDPTASGNDADPRGYSLDRLILANVGPEESEQ